MDVEADFAPLPTEFSLTYLGTPVLQGKARGQGDGSNERRRCPPTVRTSCCMWSGLPARSQPPGRCLPPRGWSSACPTGGRWRKSFWSEDGTTLDAVVSVPGKTADTAP